MKEIKIHLNNSSFGETHYNVTFVSFENGFVVIEQYETDRIIKFRYPVDNVKSIEEIIYFEEE